MALTGTSRQRPARCVAGMLALAFVADHGVQDAFQALAGLRIAEGQFARHVGAKVRDVAVKSRRLGDAAQEHDSTAAERIERLRQPLWVANGLQAMLSTHGDAIGRTARVSALSTPNDVRTLSPTDLTSLEDGGKVDVIRGKGSEFRYWVWQLSTPVGKQLAVRQAVAQLMDRDAIAKNAYDGTVTPAYSIVPPGFAGQKDSFQETYGDCLDPVRVRKWKEALA